jgi:hypothetical protein
MNVMFIELLDGNSLNTCPTYCGEGLFKRVPGYIR